MKKHMLYLGFCVFGVGAFFTACNPLHNVDPVSASMTPTTNAQDDTEERFVSVSYGETVASHNMSLTFDDVLEDSRCPKGVECVWEGNAKIQLTLRTSASDVGTTVQLNTHSSYQNTVSYNGYTIHLYKLIPYPEYGVDIQLSDYKAILQIEQE